MEQPKNLSIKEPILNNMKKYIKLKITAKKPTKPIKIIKTNKINRNNLKIHTELYKIRLH